MINHCRLGKKKEGARYVHYWEHARVSLLEKDYRRQVVPPRPCIRFEPGTT